MSFYWDNLLALQKPQRDPDGTLALHLPLGDTAIAGASSDDIGQAVLHGGALDRFTAPLHYYGVGLAGEETTRDLKAVRSALEPSLTGFTAPNFVDDLERPQRTLIAVAARCVDGSDASRLKLAAILPELNATEPFHWNSTLMASARMVVLKANENSLWGSITRRKLLLVTSMSVVPKVIPIEYEKYAKSR
jgi:hypothetical protein